MREGEGGVVEVGETVPFRIGGKGWRKQKTQRCDTDLPCCAVREYSTLDEGRMPKGCWYEGPGRRGRADLISRWIQDQHEAQSPEFRSNPLRFDLRRGIRGRANSRCIVYCQGFCLH